MRRAADRRSAQPKGKVEYVMVGTAKQLEMPDIGRSRVSTDRFRGLRCVHTHLQGEALTQDDLTDLALLRLDLMSIIQVDKSTACREWSLAICCPQRLKQ